MAPEGTFVWYDLMTTDIEGAKSFYTRVLGLEIKHSGMPGPTPYYMVEAAGQPIGGAIELTAEMRQHGVVTAWMGHIQTSDVDAMAKAFADAGGVIHREPNDIPGVGRFAIVADPYGATVSLFAAAEDYTGAPPLPPGTAGDCGWRELHSLDGPAALKFYSEQFGWVLDESIDMGPMGLYQTFKPEDGGLAMGGVMTKHPAMPVPAWIYYFHVDAVGGAIERVKAAGGMLLMGPHQTPGRLWIAQFLDPQGGLFAVLSSNP